MSGNNPILKAALAISIAGIVGMGSGIHSNSGRSLEDMAGSIVIARQAAAAASEPEKPEDIVEGEYHLIVSLHTLKMYVFMNDSLMKEFAVAVGRFETPTPIGEYLILDKVKYPDWHIPPKKLKKLKKDYPGKIIPAGDPKNPITLYWIELEKMGKPGKKVSFGIHGTNKPELIPDWISMGCVRMTDEGILYIANHAPNGSRVSIMENYLPGQQQPTKIY